MKLTFAFYCYGLDIAAVRHELGIDTTMYRNVLNIFLKIHFNALPGGRLRPTNGSSGGTLLLALITICFQNLNHFSQVRVELHRRLGSCPLAGARLPLQELRGPLVALCLAPERTQNAWYRRPLLVSESTTKDPSASTTVNR